MTSDHRARASRQNGARSRGPSTAAGKARSARNSLRHGLRARKAVLLDDEDATEFGAFARALRNELAPEGALQADLVSRIVMAAWRARRADKLEAGVLGGYLEDAGRAGPDPRAALATGLSRDNYGPRALATLVRYRGSVLAEMFRSLAALKMLQAEAPGRRAAGSTRLQAPAGNPNEPEKARQNSTLAEDGAAELPVASRPGAAAPVPYGGLR